MPNLSIIIPVYNTEKYLKECIDSILNQNYSDFEIILVNDGSKDNSKKICEEYSKKDSRIIFFDKENEGVSLTRNFGITKARGKYITFIDADDWLEKEAYYKIFNILEKNQDVDLFIYNFNYYKDSKIENKCAPETFFVENEEIKKVQATLLNPNYFSLTKFNTKFKGLAYPWNKIFKRSIIVDNNLQFRIINRKAVYEDLLFVYEYLQYSNKVYFLKEELYNYRVVGESASNKYNEEIVNINNELFDNLLNLDKNNMEEEFFKQSFYVRVINNFYLSLNSYFYNKKNLNKVRDKIKSVKKLLNEKIYNEAFQRIKIDLLSGNLKIVTILVKFKMFYLLYIYCKFIEFIVKK